eukprot:2696203-Amphidinium_carterae.1
MEQMYQESVPDKNLGLVSAATDGQPQIREMYQHTWCSPTWAHIRCGLDGARIPSSVSTAVLMHCQLKHL